MIRYYCDCCGDEIEKLNMSRNMVTKPWMPSLYFNDHYTNLNLKVTVESDQEHVCFSCVQKVVTESKFDCWSDRTNATNALQNLVAPSA